MAKSKDGGAVAQPEGAQFQVVEPVPMEYDVATAYALLGEGTIPPVLRGDDLEDL